ncbi:MAG: hypothetical protein JWO55_381 [Candidatus Saccharibacteria bacterium]|jgi:hypothetical protein|nr:hypothetical protein [Candidatus Saccharibacteria bacterium]
MSDDNQTDKLIAPVLSINIGEILRPVTHVRRDLKELANKRDAIAAKIEDTDPDDTDLLEKLKRDLAGIKASIVRLDDPMKARLGHAYTPTADST